MPKMAKMQKKEQKKNFQNAKMHMQKKVENISLKGRNAKKRVQKSRGCIFIFSLATLNTVVSQSYLTNM